MTNEKVETMRMSNGKLRGFSTVGSYPIFYVDGNNSVVCFRCANDEDHEIFGGLVDCDINYEDRNMTCDCCSDRIESAYAG